MSITFTPVAGENARQFDPFGVEWPAHSIVVFAHEGDKVVARSAIVPVPHIEGTWVDESKRGSTVAPRLIKVVEEALRSQGATCAFAFTPDDQPEIGDYMERFGYKEQPMRIWLKEF